MAETGAKDITRSWDGAGLAISSLCVVHCTALPLVAGLLPAAGIRLLANRYVHWWFLGGAAATGLLAFGPSARRHRRIGPLLLALAAYGVLFAGACVAYNWPFRRWEGPLSIAGGLLLVLAHILNLSACKAACGTAPRPGG